MYDEGEVLAVSEGMSVFDEGEVLAVSEGMSV